MAARDHLSDFQFHTNPLNQGLAEVSAYHGNKHVGSLEWGEDEVEFIQVDPSYRRQGVATELWKRANEAHKTDPSQFPKPVHSKELTPKGRLWVKSLKEDDQ